MQVRALVERPRRHKDGLVLELHPVDPDRTGRLHAFLSGDLIREIQDATGILLDPSAIFGEHELTVTVTAEPLGNLTAGVAGFVRDAFLTGWAEQDAAVRDGLEADFLWVRQHDLPVPRRLRRVFLIEPDDGAQHPLVDALAHWWDRGAIELIRHPIAFEQLNTAEALRHAFDCAIDQYEWGSLDVVVVDPGSGFAFRELSEDGLMRQVAVLPVPVITRRASSPTLLDGLAHRCFDLPDEILAFLAGILRQELRLADRARLDAMAELIAAIPKPKRKAETPRGKGETLFD
ncbi:protein of unassigned function [Methylobacterium oryzae CBMB20]|uniref:Protein of unassigned function n=1 Tax=Methylobacterium oryzae CBMB20 TaxID=693986 RepID=A0A089NND3_9HYPH|nr:protein of unassigned function [Methylobacterium oryzae CBMB20]